MNTTDTKIQKKLKYWAKGQTPPPNIKNQLLRSAAAPRLSFSKSKPIKIPVFPTELVSWATVYSLDRGVTNLNFIR
jgi:hypothetical protein